MTSSATLTKAGPLAEASSPAVAHTPSGRPVAEASRRRIPLWLLAAAGALAAGTYATLVEKMRLGPPLVMLCLGGMTLALAGAALWRVIDPLARAAWTAAPSGRGARRPRELEREKQLVLKAIKEIELDYQMRKIAERDYREMIERYRTRAMRLIGEIEAGDDYRVLIERELAMRIKLAPEAAASAASPSASPAAVPAPVPPAAPSERPTCASCGTPNDPDAQFCKKCGARLSSL
jgi:zinc-ribbon domain